MLRTWTYPCLVQLFLLKPTPLSFYQCHHSRASVASHQNVVTFHHSAQFRLSSSPFIAMIYPPADAQFVAHSMANVSPIFVSSSGGGGGGHGCSVSKTASLGDGITPHNRQPPNSSSKNAASTMHNKHKETLHLPVKAPGFIHSYQLHRIQSSTLTRDGSPTHHQ